MVSKPEMQNYNWLEANVYIFLVLYRCISSQSFEARIISSYFLNTVSAAQTAPLQKKEMKNFPRN